MGRTRVTGKVEPIVKKWLSKDEAKSYIGCSDDFLRTLREKALISFSQFGKMIWYDLSSIDRFITVIYVLVCNYLNVKRHGGESSMYR